MLGQYPHCQPATPGPSQADAQANLRRVFAAGVTCFTCLQGELPPQDDVAAWPAEGVPLPDEADRSRWPDTFVRYAVDADAIASELGLPPPRYLHCPIPDLSTPKDSEALYALLDQIIQHFEGEGAVYLHCWGGRGRAGLVGACLLSLCRPDLSGDAVLSAVQAAYDTRSGASAMPGALKRSPQTEAQRQYVKSFVSSVRMQRNYANDMAMLEGGMPKGFI